MNDAEELQRLRAEVAQLRSDNARLSELLDIAQEFGRLGVWERDPRTLQGRWDRHVFRFFGFEEGDTPHFDEAAARIHPDDRLAEAFLASLHVPGVHAQRYRVERPDGSVAHIHSQWAVIAGPDGRAARVVGVMVDDTEIRQLAEQAGTARAELELALSVSAIGMWRRDLATGRIHYDRGAQDMLGLETHPDGVTLDIVRRWMHPDDFAEAEQAFAETLATGGPVDTQTRFRHADGRWRTLLMRRALQRDAAGKPQAVIGVALDVTEQQQRTLEALRLASRLESAAEAARMGLWWGPMDAQLPVFNPRMFTILGRDPAEGPMGLGDVLRKYTHPEDRDRVARQALAWVQTATEAALDVEARIIRPDGKTRWIEVRGRQEVDADGVRQAFGVIMDVTEQRQVVSELREAHERTMLALSSVGMGTWSHDVTTGTDVWDEQMFRLRGIGPRDRALSNDERMAMVAPEDREAVIAASMPLLSSAEALAYEFRIVRASDGEVRTLASRSIALTDAQGRLTRRLGVNWDVTEVRLLEQAQREREVALRESRTKSALFSRVSHELRTPLNAVLGFTQLLLVEGERGDPAQRRRRLEQIHSAGSSLLALVDGVLDLNEQAGPSDESQRTPVCLADAVERALEPLASAIAARELQVVRGDLSAVVWGDMRRLQQLLAQLLGNAVKFNRAKGLLRVHARIEGREAVLGVADTGLGISAERAGRLFEAFDGDANLAAGGRGLGLAIAQALAQRMGGRVALVRTGSDGSLFELRLPLAEVPASSAAGSVQPRVLYIEDNDVNMLIVRELMTQRPHIAFHGAVDGMSGLEAARALMPALVLIDMQLPDIDGMEVMRRLRADPATASVTCVALSANAMPEDARRALDAGFDDYWTKPIELPAFLASLDRLVPTS